MNNSINIREIYKIILHIVLSQDKYQIKRVLPTKTHKKIPYKNQYESTLIRKGLDRVKDFYNEKEELVDLDEKIDELQSTISNVNITVDQLNSLRNQISTLKSQKEDLIKKHNEYEFLNSEQALFPNEKALLESRVNVPASFIKDKFEIHINKLENFIMSTCAQQMNFQLTKENLPRIYLLCLADIFLTITLDGYLWARSKNYPQTTPFSYFISIFNDAKIIQPISELKLKNCVVFYYLCCIRDKARINQYVNNIKIIKDKETIENFADNIIKEILKFDSYDSAIDRLVVSESLESDKFLNDLEPNKNKYEIPPSHSVSSDTYTKSDKPWYSELWGSLFPDKKDMEIDTEEVDDEEMEDAKDDEVKVFYPKQKLFDDLLNNELKNKIRNYEEPTGVKDIIYNMNQEKEALIQQEKQRLQNLQEKLKQSRQRTYLKLQEESKKRQLEPVEEKMLQKYSKMF